MNLRTIRKRGLALLLAGVMTVGLAPAALAIVAEQGGSGAALGEVAAQVLQSYVP